MKVKTAELRKRLERRNWILFELYQSGMSCQEIHDKHLQEVGVRQMQRLLKSKGIIRSQSESFVLAIKNGRMKYQTMSEEDRVKRKTIGVKTRSLIMQRDQFRCQLCGANKDTCLRLEIDHVDENPSNNDERNLRVLCDLCNRGKSVLAGKYQRKRKYLLNTTSK